VRARYSIELQVWVVLLLVLGGTSRHAFDTGDRVTSLLAIFLAWCVGYCLREVTFRDALRDAVDRALSGKLLSPRPPR
jgi:hypothetical protein